MSYAIPGVARYRVNVYFQRGALGAAFRLIPEELKTLDDLKRVPFIDMTYDPEWAIWLRAVGMGDFKPKRVLKKPVTISYSGEGRFHASTSSKMVLNQKALRSLARPMAAFLGRGGGRAPSVSSLPK